MAEQERFIPAIADTRRVCCCICPVNHGSTTGICELFVEQGQPVILAHYGSTYAARCLPCARAGGYQEKPAPAKVTP